MSEPKTRNIGLPWNEDAYNVLVALCDQDSGVLTAITRLYQEWGAAKVRIELITAMLRISNAIAAADQAEGYRTTFRITAKTRAK